MNRIITAIPAIITAVVLLLGFGQYAQAFWGDNYCGVPWSYTSNTDPRCSYQHYSYNYGGNYQPANAINGFGR